MLTNYFKIALRNLLRHKAFSFINIFGLSIGMACSILILLWTQDELSYDRFHSNGDRIYRITSLLAELEIKAAVSSAPMAAALQQGIPTIVNTVRLAHGGELMQVEDRMFNERKIFFADSTFFDVFSYPLAEGDQATALAKPESVVITQEMARKYFGEEKALGKIIRREHKDDLLVTGVFADIPANSHLKFDFIQPMSFLARTNRDLQENVWDNFNFYTYIQLDKSFAASPAAITALEKQIKDIYFKNEQGLKVEFKLQPLQDIHLRSNNLLADLGGHGNIQYVYVMIVVAIFILVVACINFMNLATARSARRAKEVGLRKVAGAARAQLILQFLAESSIIAFIALTLSIALVLAALPLFNNLAGKELLLNILDRKILLMLIGITVLTGMLSGSYPALFLSGFLPVKVLKGNLKAGATGSIFRNALVVVQFTVSIILLVGTTVIYRQLQFIRERNMGFDKENLIHSRMTGDLWSKYSTLRTTLEQNHLTHNFTFVSDLPTNLMNSTINVVWEGKNPDSQPLFSTMAVDDNFMSVFNTTLLAGRNFSRDIKSDSTNMIVNEKALQTMGMDIETAIGKPLSLWNNKGTIIGVIKDFNFKPIQQPIEPLILRSNWWGGIAVVRCAPGQTEATIRQMEHVFKQLNPSNPFDYYFVDQDIANLYESEQRLSALFKCFAALAILISCLGLYGLSAFLAERRTKEIGVRKALGAPVYHLLYLLSKSFTRPVLVAMVIATPVAWVAMNYWLQGFAYHVEIHWSIFLFAFAISLCIAWITVSYESVKAALANPTESLKNE